MSRDLQGGILSRATFSELGVGLVPLLYVVNSEGVLLLRALADPRWLEDPEITPTDHLAEQCS